MSENEPPQCEMHQPPYFRCKHKSKGWIALREDSPASAELVFWFGYVRETGKEPVAAAYSGESDWVFADVLLEGIEDD